MKIDVVTGSVRFDSGTIRPDTEREAFLDSVLGNGATPLNVNEPFARYGFRPEPGISASIQFCESRTISIAFDFRFPDDSKDNWTKERELLRKARHEDWLQQEIGEPPYRFSWGSIESIFSPRDCESEIVVNFERRTSIDAATGVLTFGLDTLDSRQDQNAFLRTSTGKHSKLRVGEDGWAYIDFEPAPRLFVQACFHLGQLKDVYITFPMQSDWVKSWRTVAEWHRKDVHDDWLREELGDPPYIFRWGEVISKLGHQSTGKSEIHVNYGGPLDMGDRIKRRLRHWARRLQEID